MRIGVWGFGGSGTRKVGCGVAALFGLMGAGWGGAPRFEGIGDLPGGSFFSAGYGISADGKTIVGQSFNSAFASGFRWNSGQMTGLGDLAGGSSECTGYGCSADGSTVVGYCDSSTGYQAFRWTGGVITGLGDLTGGVFDSTAFGCSADGSVIVGTGNSANGYEAFRWAGGVMTGLGDLSGGFFDSGASGVSANGQIICGTGSSSNGYEAFRWTSGVMTGLGDLPGGIFDSGAFGMSGDGLTIVGRGSSEMGTEAFRWFGGVMDGLGDLPGGDFYSEAYGCSQDGSVVVGYSYSGDGNDAFLWDEVNGMQSLYTVMNSIYLLDASTENWQVISATAVSASGREIAGYGLNPQGNLEGFRVVIPNPGTVAGHANLAIFEDMDLAIGFPVEIEIREPGTLNVVESHSTVLEDSGIWFFETAERGTFDFAVKVTHWLRKVVHGRTIDDFGSFSIDALLINGDVDEDNEISLVDVGLLSSAFGSVPEDENWIANADLDGDGEVNILDYAVLAANFGVSGDE